MKVEIPDDHYYFRILINGLPHLIIEKPEKIMFHSWNDSPRQCYIEFITSNGKIKLEYDSIDKWKQILKALNDNL